MKALFTSCLILLSASQGLFAQHDFDYRISLKPVTVSNLPGLHSFAYGQHNGKWLIIGGRKDGLHPRQPFASFPSSHNNDSIYVVDITTKQVWRAALSGLPGSVTEQLQSTNMNFHQVEDSLYILGGYAYSNSKQDHITFPYLTTITVSNLIDDIVNRQPIKNNFKQIEDSNFAVCGGQLNVLNDTFYLVGGQKFTGRYNPMGHATYVQEYTDQIRKFTLNNQGATPHLTHYSEIKDPVHLHRRDYNLLPMLYKNNQPGLLISAGVFQTNVDLPFLYPVEITSNGYVPKTSFNQYLSHYHSARVSLHDSARQSMQLLFFGGMSQYYYQDTNLIKDDQVPFVKTISRLSRTDAGDYKEFQMATTMPELIGASAEFFINQSLPHNEMDLVYLPNKPVDTILLGHIVGGIYSPTLNPFNSNQSSTTSAHPTVYEVSLIPDQTVSSKEINGHNPYQVRFSPNPIINEIGVHYSANTTEPVSYFITNKLGQMIQSGYLHPTGEGMIQQRIKLNQDIPTQMLYITLVFEGKYFVSEALLKH